MVLNNKEQKTGIFYSNVVIYEGQVKYYLHNKESSSPTGKTGETIYEVIRIKKIQESEVFIKEPLKYCQDLPNEPQFIPKKIRKGIQTIGP